MKYAILTFGCRVNQADSFDIDEDLRAGGAVETAPESADLVVVNTCTVTGAADQGARQTIRRLARVNPGVRVVVTGCYATRTPELLSGLPNVAAVVPNDDKPRLVALIRDAASPHGAVEPWGSPDEEGCGIPGPGAMGRTAHPLRVQTGCDEVCAYCIIPSTRGRSRSRSIGDVVREASRLSEAGYKEMWLVGVHLGSYGRDLPQPSSLLELVRALDRLPGDLTFRISSLEPMDCSDDLVDLVAASGRFAPHVHLPLQHASDAVLRAMRRPYTFASFQRLVDRVHARMPHAFIGTDVIVGFPGEQAADIRFALDVLPGLPLAALHVFPYSDRPGTAATNMAPKVASADITERAKALRDVGRELGTRFVAAMRGAVRPGLTLEDGRVVLTDNFLKVRIPPGLPRNTRVLVRITDVEPTMAGTLVTGA